MHIAVGSKQCVSERVSVHHQEKLPIFANPVKANPVNVLPNIATPAHFGEGAAQELFVASCSSGRADRMYFIGCMTCIFRTCRGKTFG